ncbi:MAG TPA: hypothetical protein DDZ80_21200 [Cyanobacteria bacterium UBA8803]|nr:hypothetical protein [Cyanobacteria bacterium UBA9273]HBL60859.1 hypothetical protein [Cyanobacteria bacterium UBA8803]
MVSAVMSVNPVGWIEILAGTVCLLFSGLFGYFAITMLRKNYQMATKGILTSGVITGHKITRGTLFSPRSTSEEIEFQTLNGEKVSFVLPFSVSGGALRASGTKVKVLYNPKNPQDALDASFFHFWFFPLCMLASALGGVYLSFCLFFGINPP